MRGGTPADLYPMISPAMDAAHSTEGISAERATPPGASRLWRLAGLGAVIATIAVRLARIRDGLPELLEEAMPLRLAMGMLNPHGAIDWNPHAFNYPSLTIYLHLLVQGL